MTESFRYPPHPHAYSHYPTSRTPPLRRAPYHTTHDSPYSHPPRPREQYHLPPPSSHLDPRARPSSYHLPLPSRSLAPSYREHIPPYDSRTRSRQPSAPLRPLHHTARTQPYDRNARPPRLMSPPRVGSGGGPGTLDSYRFGGGPAASPQYRGTRGLSASDPVDVDQHVLNRATAQRDEIWRKRREAEKETMRREEEARLVRRPETKEVMRYRQDMYAYDRQREQVLLNQRDESRKRAMESERSRHRQPSPHGYASYRPHNQPFDARTVSRRVSVPRYEAAPRQPSLNPSHADWGRDGTRLPSIAASIPFPRSVDRRDANRHEATHHAPVPADWGRRSPLSAGIPTPPGHPSQLFRRDSIASVSHPAAMNDRRGSVATGLREGAPPLSRRASRDMPRIEARASPAALAVAAQEWQKYMAASKSMMRPTGLTSRLSVGRGTVSQQREALLREQEVMIGKAREAIVLAQAKKEKDAAEASKLAERKKAKANEDPAMKRRIQLQVFVHARPTYCRWGECRAVLNSWGLLEKHIHHAHIKHLPIPPMPPIDSTPSKMKNDFRCHWNTCAKTFSDKEKMYRHCLMEHMGQFCARCPFDCLFEGPTFPSLMAHIARRHPTKTPDDFVPGLIHFAPSPRSLPPLPTGDVIITKHDSGLASTLSSTQIVAPYLATIEKGLSKQSAVTGTRRRSVKKGSEERNLTRVEKTQQSRTETTKRVAGRVISEVVRLVVAAATAKRAGSLSESGPTEKLGYASPVTIQFRSEELGGIDIKSIAKQARAAIKAESNDRDGSPALLVSTSTCTKSLPHVELQSTYAVSESDSGSPPQIITIAPSDGIDIWAKLGFGARPVADIPKITTKSPSLVLTLNASPSADEPSLSIKRKRDWTTFSTSNRSESVETDTDHKSNHDRDSMEYVPRRSVSDTEIGARETRRAGNTVGAGESGLSVKVEPGVSQSESDTPPNTSELKIRLRVPRIGEVEARDEVDNDEARWRLRPRRRGRADIQARHGTGV